MTSPERARDRCEFLADDLRAVTERATRQASRSREMIALAGEVGNYDDPYELLFIDLHEARNVLDTALRHLEFLKTHDHVWSDQDMCIHCNADGRM